MREPRDEGTSVLAGEAVILASIAARVAQVVRDREDA
jgi:hypothetical protein